jgi:hypothetical protein
MTREEIEGLLGAYALDAVTDLERRRVERAVAADPELRAEAETLLAAADLLAADLADDVPAPARVWKSIAAEIDAGGRVVPLRAPAPRRRWFTAVASAAAVALVAVLGIQVFLQRSEIADLRDDPLAAAAEATAEQQGSLRVPLSGSASADVVLGPDGVGYVLGDELEPLESGSTYQLWAIVDDRVVSAGVLGPSPGIAPFHVDGPVSGFALTVERAGGVVSSDREPIAVGTLEG